MSRKFSNKRIIVPKTKIVKGKKRKVSNKKPKPDNVAKISPVNFSGGNKLYLIMSSYGNKKYNIDSSIDTWVGSISKNNDHCFVVDRSIGKTNHFTVGGVGKYSKTHDSYSNYILLELFKQKMSELSNRYDRICFCTDTTYINDRNFNNEKSHWGYVSALLPSSTSALSAKSNKIYPEEVRMYHGEAGFCLDSSIAKEIANLIGKHDDLILDRWDATIGYCMHKLGAKFNHDESVNLFPHTILNHSSKEIYSAKSYGYLKFYDKKNVSDTLNSKK